MAENACYILHLHILYTVSYSIAVYMRVQRAKLDMPHLFSETWFVVWMFGLSVEDHEIGDGTTGVVVMAGALLEKAWHFLGRNEGSMNLCVFSSDSSGIFKVGFE